MFDKARYLTRGVNETVPLAVQVLLWRMVEDAALRTPLDYLQVFRLTPATLDGKTAQEVVHEQEQPPYSVSFTFPFVNPLSATLFIIDDGEHATMLFPQER